MLVYVNVRQLRSFSGHTQKDAAKTIYRDRYQTWAEWEREGRMPAAECELYLIKTGNTAMLKEFLRKIQWFIPLFKQKQSPLFRNSVRRISQVWNSRKKWTASIPELKGRIFYCPLKTMLARSWFFHAPLNILLLNGPKYRQTSSQIQHCVKISAWSFSPWMWDASDG